MTMIIARERHRWRLDKEGNRERKEKREGGERGRRKRVKGGRVKEEEGTREVKEGVKGESKDGGGERKSIVNEEEGTK